MYLLQNSNRGEYLNIFLGGIGGRNCFNKPMRVAYCGLLHNNSQSPQINKMH